MTARVPQPPVLYGSAVREGSSVLFDGPCVLISTGVRELNLGGIDDTGEFISYRFSRLYLTSNFSNGVRRVWVWLTPRVRRTCCDGDSERVYAVVELDFIDSRISLTLCFHESFWPCFRRQPVSLILNGHVLAPETWSWWFLVPRANLCSWVRFLTRSSSASLLHLD